MVILPLKKSKNGIFILDKEPNMDTIINGKWVNAVSGLRELQLNNGNFEVSYDEMPVAKGTYTISGNNATATVTHLHGDMVEAESKWYTKTEAKPALKILYENEMTDAEIDEILTDYFMVLTGTYSINGNELVMTTGGNSITFTKK